MNQILREPGNSPEQEFDLQFFALVKMEQRVIIKAAVYKKQNNKPPTNKLISQWKIMGRRQFCVHCLVHNKMVIRIGVLTQVVMRCASVHLAVWIYKKLTRSDDISRLRLNK